MFKRLRKIGGEQLLRKKYSLVVLENANLRSLFDSSDNRSITLLNGRAQFQNNRVLCFENIQAFAAASRLQIDEGDDKARGYNRDLHDVGIIEASRYTNGDRAICTEERISVTITSVTSESIELEFVAVVIRRFKT